ncbi:MAG: hypothetical protein NTU57_04090 [Candidatus Aenigmarchaeota archaeon]|nr:hypothetical protein [Candidatus Aenigmarchaeota archaeon]
MKIGNYLRVGFAAATILGTAACENTIFDGRYKGEGSISGVEYRNGVQVLRININRQMGDYFEMPPLMLPSPTEAPVNLVLASRTPIKCAHAGDRLRFKFKHDENRNDFEKEISGWTKRKWCQVYHKR